MLKPKALVPSYQRDIEPACLLETANSHIKDIYDVFPVDNNDPFLFFCSCVKGGDDEKEEIFSSFLNRTADDNRRRKEEREKDEKERLFDVTRFDPECTFRPALNKDAKYDHLTGIFERLEGQGFEERMDDDVRMRQAAARRAARERGPIIDHLPNYLKANEGWLSDYRHPDRMPGYYDAEEAGYGGSIIAHGPFDEDRHGRPLTKMQMGNGVTGREESKHEGDGNKRLDDKVLGTGWIED